MYKRILIFILVTFLASLLYAQKSTTIQLVPTREKTSNTEKVQISTKKLVFVESFSSIELFEKETKEGTYRQLISRGMSKSYNTGKPDLPVITKLIEIPANSKAKVKILSYDKQIVNLKDYNISKKIIPAQPSIEKSKGPKDVPFYKDQNIYKKNSFFKNELIKFEDRGFLRSKHLGYIEISPFQYNPVTNTLKVFNNIKVEVSFVKDNSKSVNTKTLQSPYFKNIAYNTLNKVEESKDLISNPVKYVIVSDPMFEETLQPFIEWKTIKGFNVITAYTDDPGVGNTTTTIKAYLKDLYDNPSDGVSPTFVLLVGDVGQIPTFNGTSSSHYTDLYYCEYTDDKLPEVFYGRFSAESVAELQPQIDKTLEVEKYQMPDPSYLDNIVLVAGVDNNYAPTYGNGAINYANSYYTNETNSITSYYYLYNDDSGVMASNNSGASESIRNYINQGVSFSNYTAHCSSNGWSNPGFNTGHISSLTNEHMYPLIIGNCCQSNTFYDNDCFGEEILKAENKGAVGYIGGSNNTYWDEDYYWGVGLVSTVVVNPTYENSGLGAYDKFFHLNGEAKQNWYITQGQINVAGNLAVEASGSSRKTYYWEIYHLMGDPSLTPFVSVPDILFVSYDTEIFEKSININVTTEEDAYVAISKNGVLFDAKLAGESGIVSLALDSTDVSDTLNLVITKQNCQPVIEEILVIPRTTPYVVLDTFLIDDDLENANGKVDYGENVNLNVQLKNVSKDYDSFLIEATLSTSDTNVVITDSTENFGTILKSANTLINDAFSVEFKNKFPDQYNVEFEIKITGEDSENTEYEWTSILEVPVNAPLIHIGDILFDDSSTGNDDQIPDAGETGDILLIVSNEGNDSITNIVGNITVLGDGGNYLTLNNSVTGSFTINANETDTLSFNVSVDAAGPMGKNLFFLFEVNDTDYNYYSKSENKELVIGDVQEVLISAGDTVITNSANFYDSGGKNNNYNDNEDYIITFIPDEANAKLIVDFKSFSVEKNSDTSCFDYLNIYDGDTIAANLIGTYCNSNIPGKIIATNPNGSLTFEFISDISKRRSGWEAEIRSFVPHDFQITVNDAKGPLEKAYIDFNGEKDTTGADGVVTFNNISEGIDLPLQVLATGYKNYETTIDLFANISKSITLEKAKYNVKFYIYDETYKLADSTSISFLGEKRSSTSDGKYTFSDIEYCENEKYTITREGYFSYIDSVDVNSNKSIKITLEKLICNVAFKVYGTGDVLLENVKIEFNSSEKYTDRNGYAIFEKIEPTKGMSYNLTVGGYYNNNGTINVEKADTTVTIHMSINTGIEDIYTENIRVYPNPSEGFFNIEINNPEYDRYIINVYDVIGSTVYNKEINGITKINEEINISEKSKGIYFLIIKTKEKILLSRKLLIQ